MLGIRQILPVSVQHAGESSPGSADHAHTIATKNRWSRVVLKFENLTPDVWCEFGFQINWHPSEEARNVHDFAVVGVDFLTEDGSSIDFAYVPGLTRAQIDPYSDYVAGPGHYSRNVDRERFGKVHCNFLVPGPARQLLVTIRSWRNTHPFQIGHPLLRQFVQPGSPGAIATEQQLAPSKAELDASSIAQRDWPTLGSQPAWFSYAVVPGHRFFVRGQIITKETGHEGALARVVFRNASGEELPPPYPETQIAPTLGAFINIPAHIQARRFTLELVPPPQAVTVDLGFQTWRSDAVMELVAPLEVSLEDNLLLETISGNEPAGAMSFIERLTQQLGIAPSADQHPAPSQFLDLLIDRHALTSLLTIQERFRAVQRGKQSQTRARNLKFDGFSDWPLPEEPSWTEDPFHSPAWRLEYHSLLWLREIARQDAPQSLSHALKLALSWSRANPWGQPEDALSVHPQAMAARAEVLLELLAMGAASSHKAAPENLLELTGEVVRHGFALAEIISQNIFSHSVYQVHTASALLALSKALPRLPLANYWSSIAFAHLRDAFDQMIGPDGRWFEQSQHHRLELISLGLILIDLLEKLPEPHDLRQRLTPRLKESALTTIMLTDPAGMLPSIGDTPHVCHHASWLRRLIAQYGQDLVNDKAIRSELAYPEGPRIFSLPKAGIVAARHYQQGREWSHLCVTVPEQRHPHGHYDSTSFVFSAGGVKWITDPGGSSQNEVGSARHYLMSSRAHNVAIPDGREQTAGAAWLRSAASIDGANVFEISTNVHGPDYVHRRIFICLNDLSAIAIFDRFATAQKPASFEGYLHFDPAVMVAIANPHLAVGFRNRKRLRIRPHAVSGQPGGIELIQGLNNRTSPLQGFVSKGPGALETANALRYTFTGESNLCGGIIMALDELDQKTMMRIIGTPSLKEILEQPLMF